MTTDTLTTKTFEPIVVATPHTPEWYAARATGIGASEIAAAAGLSTYQSALELYHHKRGELPPIEDNDAMRRGRRLEPYIKEEWELASGLKLIDREPAMMRHPEYSFCLATPDGFVEDGSLLETKTTSYRMKGYWGDPGSDRIPTEYVCQAQWQMAVTGAELCRVVVMFDQHNMPEYYVVRHEDLINHLLRIGGDLWRRILDGDPPPADYEHPKTPELIKSLATTVTDTRVELPEQLVAAWLRREEAAAEIKRWDAVMRANGAEVEHFIGEHFAGVLPDGRMIRRKLIAKAPYTVTPKPYWDIRVVKFDGGRMVDAESRIDASQLEIESRWLDANNRLEEAGGVQLNMSDAGSVYWRMPSGRKVRVANHPANADVRQRMEREDYVEIRVDIPTVDIAAAVAAICAAELVETGV